jgi:hypothetical protein
VLDAVPARRTTSDLIVLNQRITVPRHDRARRGAGLAGASGHLAPHRTELPSWLITAMQLPRRRRSCRHGIDIAA